MELDSHVGTLASWTLLLGPGPRLRGLRPVLAAIVEDRMGPGGPPVRAVDDLVAILHEDSPAGRIVLDTDAILPDDLGLVRRFLTAHPAWEVLLTGVEEGSRAARGLLALEGPRWRRWPLDVEQLNDLVAPTVVPAAAPEPAVAPDPDPTRHHFRDLEDDLQAIEMILAQASNPGLLADLDHDVAPPIHDDPLDPRGVDLTPEEIEAFFSPDLPETPFPGTESSGTEQVAIATAPPPARTVTTSADWAPPPWYKDQVADLADRAQRLHLALEAGEDPAQSEALALDVLGLTQFARTLGFLAAPPGRGEQEFALATVLEELLAGLAGAREDGPRYLFRPDPAVRVRSDKALLCTALDALFQLADACAGPDDVVRVSLESLEDEFAIDVRFPAGPLMEVPSEGALAPYALRRAVPAIGPNAMAAAGRILQGQGGDLAFGEGPEEGERVLRVTLPQL